jgi:hypothetical protein
MVFFRVEALFVAEVPAEDGLDCFDSGSSTSEMTQSDNFYLGMSMRRSFCEALTSYFAAGMRFCSL